MEKPEDRFQSQFASEVTELPGDKPGAYPRFEHVAGAPGVGIGDKLYIECYGPEPTAHDLSHLFPDR